jgi:ABC-type multidrug transport system fused ATPase/permease subunit
MSSNRDPDWRAYFRAFTPHRNRLAAAAVCAVAKSAMLVVLAIVLRLEAAAAAEASAARLVVLLISGVGLAALAGLFSYHARLITVSVTKDVVAGFQSELVDRLLALPPEHVDRIGRDALRAVIATDTHRLDRMTSAIAGLVLPAAATALALLAVLCWLAPLYGLASVAVGVAATLGRRRLAERIARIFEPAERSLRAYERGVDLTLRRHEMARAGAHEPFERGERRRDIETLRAMTEKAVRDFAALREIETLLSAAALLSMLCIGAIFARAGTSIADLVSALVILMLLKGQMNVVMGALGETAEGISALRRVQDLLGAVPPPPYSGRQAPSRRYRLRLEQVEFSYGDAPLLRKIDLDLHPGRCCALVGPNGAGKTTIVRLLLGLARPESGRLHADGTPYEALDMRAFRSAIGLVPQNPVLFPGTIAQNIGYGRIDASDAAILEAARLAGVSAFAAMLPDGLATMLGDDGAPLSGGQRQRIAIARSLLGRPKLLIFDEPTNHVDADGISDFSALLRRVPGQPAILMITHSIELAAVADEIFELRDGAISWLSFKGAASLRAAAL